MNNLSSHPLEVARHAIAAKMAAYEAEFGPVQTLPIYVGERPKQTFVINVPGKPKVRQQSTKLRADDQKRVLLRTTRKMEKVARIRALAITGMKIADIVEQAGFTPQLSAKYVMRIILEHGLSRGPKP